MQKETIFNFITKLTLIEHKIIIINKTVVLNDSVKEDTVWTNLFLE